MEKKVLTLTVTKQWFDMIADGRKNEEYRTIKGYWVKRLFLLWKKKKNVVVTVFGWDAKTS